MHYKKYVLYCVRMWCVCIGVCKTKLCLAGLSIHHFICNSWSRLIADNMPSPMICKVLREGKEALFWQVLSGEGVNEPTCCSEAAKSKFPLGFQRDSH